MFGDGSKAAAIESAIVFPNPSSHSHFHPISPSYSPIPQSHSHRTLTLPPSTPSKSNSVPAPNQMDDPSPALFITGGLFLEPTIPNSLLNSVVSFKKNSPSSAVVSGAGSSCWCRPRAVAGGGFLSVSLNSDGVVRESKGCLVQNGDESSEETAPAVVTERKREKVGVRSRRAMNTTNHLWAGAIAAMVSRTFVAPLERLKLEYIVRGEQRHLFELVKTIAANQGLRGFWKGNLVNILRTAPFKAINFYAYDTYRKQLLRFSGNKETTNFERFVAGAAAGITAATLCLPLDTIRTQLVAPGGEALGGVIGAFRHMIQTEGFFSLYKGLVPSIASMAPAGAVFYGVYDILKSTYLHSHGGRKRIDKMSQQGRGRSALDQLELGPVRTLLYGAISGACAEAATYPFEVVRRQLQLQVQATKMNALATGIKIVEHGGVPALYAGLIPSLLQVLPSAAISYFVYEFMKIVLKVE
ncbi:mitochondrial adenine nucleotide transporter BTL2 [Pyrus ussuriensis x Pyrus communis]|uniref:Mitochondrial adenine nucleotide transporter BTL2 n=1 Tax=Pyrus ussuriensis x Pyrus communis TaxID=2448454 RepID=A0A5N5GVB2_9ROSA|nr:mitochondrial adenine nucleotide transporter BTL2 [Pyrus ussuriensis x Pyrus communis]